MLTDELLLYIFDGQSHPLASPAAFWLSSSRRFTNFVNTFRDKIRKKLRTIHDPQGMLDLQLELETAYLLLQERSLSLLYEPQRSEKLRHPDFAVTYTTSLTFMVEVTRIQTGQKSTIINTDPPPAISTLEERLLDTVCSKLGQLFTQRSNVLILGVETLTLTKNELHLAMLRIQKRAEGSDLNFMRRYQFRDRADFFQHYQRLSEVFIRESNLQGVRSITSWANPQAKYPLPSRVRTALYRSHNVQL
jgi:hypothetical protein